MADKLNYKQDTLRAFNRSVQLQPNQAAVWTQIGVLQVEIGNRAAARTSFARALAVDPNFQPTQQQLQNLGVQ